MTALPTWERRPFTERGVGAVEITVPTLEEICAGRRERASRGRVRRQDIAYAELRQMGLQCADDQPHGAPITFVDPLAAWRPMAPCRSDSPPRSLCRDGCPVRWLCLEHALRTREAGGTWGGLTTYAREVLLEAHAGDAVEALIAVWQSEHPEEAAA